MAVKSLTITELNSAAELKFNPQQPRDSHGRWTTTGGGGVTGDTKVGNTTVSKVEDHLASMFNDPSPNAWGGSGFIQATIRNKFNLTHQQAKEIHRQWAAKEEKNK